jgi:3-hydroxyisobutyrate dehydrogenase-like beta-hydroxyacid dehydrogenase
VSGDRAAVSVVGLGNMGQAIGDRVLAGGYALTVYNRTPGRDADLVAAGATRLESVGDALVAADVCLTSLPDDDAVLEVVCGEGGLLGGARPETTLLEASTISVSASARVADTASEAGVRYLRTPLSGNPGAVRGGKAAVFVSGPESVFEEHEELLRAIAPTARYVGEDERARVVKLTLQILIGGIAELLSEAVVLGETAGVEREALLDVIRSSVVGSTFVGYKADALVDDDYSATFTTDMMRKDVDLVLDLADETGVDLPLTRELRPLLEAVSEGGHADEDFIALVLELRRRAGEARLSRTKR